MKRYAFAIALVLLLCAFARAEDRVLVVNANAECKLTSTEAIITYSGNIENLSDKPAVIRFLVRLVDDKMNVLASVVFVGGMTPRSRTTFAIPVSFPIEKFADPKCTGVLCVVEYVFPPEVEI